MFEAQLIHATASRGTEIYSPWIPRGGDNLLATVDVVKVVGGGVSVEVATKNVEDSGDGTLVSGSLSGATAGRHTKGWGPSVLKELIRFKYTVTLEETAPEWVLFRMVPLLWFDTVNAVP